MVLSQTEVYEVEVATDRFAATGSFRAPYDPTNSRIKA
jgi:hypothetical protein